MSDVGYMESNPHGDGKNPTWADLRVMRKIPMCGCDQPEWCERQGMRHRYQVSDDPPTLAERDSLGRAWAAKNGWRLTDAEREQVARTWLRENDAVMVTRSQLESWLSDSDQQYDLEASFERLLAALEGDPLSMLEGGE